MPKVSAENPKRFKSFKKISSQKLFLWTRRKLFWKLLENFRPEVWKLFRSKSEKTLKRRIKNYFFRNFYSGHEDRSFRTMPKVSAENPKTTQNFRKKFKPKIVRLHTHRVVWQLLEVFGPKVWKNFAKNSKKFWKEKQKIN